MGQMYVFRDDRTALEKGWVIQEPFHSDGSGRYRTIAEHELGGLRRILQSIFVRFLSFTTCGCALKNKTLQRWKEEVETGKFTSEIFCLAIASNQDPNTQPEILSDDWGRISLRLNGEERQFRDVVILPSGSGGQAALPWDWSQADGGMHHRPGIRQADIDHWIFSRGYQPDVVILTRGRGHGGQRDNPGKGVLEIEAGVREYIEGRGVGEVHILKTAAAVDLYNQINMGGGRRIAALIHTTC